MCFPTHSLLPHSYCKFFLVFSFLPSFRSLSSISLAHCILSFPSIFLLPFFFFFFFFFFLQQFLYLAVADGELTAPLNTPIPTILKPTPLWTGKQIFNSLLDYITHGRSPLNLNPVKAKVPGSSWGKQGEEDGSVIVRQNVLVQGVLDKAQFGASKFGLVHAVYELYGPAAAGNLLTLLSRLFTRTLQYDGFTCGIEDMMLIPSAESRRAQLVKDSVVKGIIAAAEVAGLKDEDEQTLLQTNAVHVGLQRFFKNDPKAGERLDGAIKGALNQCTSTIISACLPHGQRKPFPHNNMAMMTLSGAKGSMVNFSQISCLLGQQELEGRRVPVTVAGKTLPSFPKYDPQPRAGGYVAQRFITGVRPQEYYFHCMAGREGLVDTAVKTSRSGYLQRCLIKHMESLSVQYDDTVRDVDGSVVQFNYGEDSIDIIKSTYLQNFTFLAENFVPLMAKLKPHQAIAKLDSSTVEEYREEIATRRNGLEERRAELVRKLAKEKEAIASGKKDKKDGKNPLEKIQKLERKLADVVQESETLDNVDPVMAKFPPGTTMGSVSEHFSKLVNDYVDQDPDGIFVHASAVQTRIDEKVEELQKKHTEAVAKVEKYAAQGPRKQIALEEAQAKMEEIEEAVTELNTESANVINRDKFRHLMEIKYAASLVAPGESVGVLAGQSVGEPSTQMTLNTFHLAGHGGANVTLGIPRLREIVMTASKNIATPIMEIPVLPGCSPHALAAKLTKITLAECLKSIRVKQYAGPNGVRYYDIKLQFKSLDSDWAKNLLLTFPQLMYAVSKNFVQKLAVQVRRKLSQAEGETMVMKMVRTNATSVRGSKGGADGADDDEGAASAEMALSTDERRDRKMLEEGVKEMARQGKGAERSSYDDDDEEDHEADDDNDDDDDDSSSDSDDNSNSNGMSDAADGKKNKKNKKSKKASSKKDERFNVKAEPGTEAPEDSDSSDNDNDDDDDENDMADSTSSSSSSSKKSSRGKASDLNMGFEGASTQYSRAMLERYKNSLFAHITSDFVRDVDYDFDNFSWARIRIAAPAGRPKVLMLSFAERAAAGAIVRQTRGINKATVLTRTVNGVADEIVQTDGVNFLAVWKHPEADCARINSNDIYAILVTYGVEAARRAIRQEVAAVFAVYGIGVDARHLQLIADHMTFQGGYTPLNRGGIDPRPAPFQKASFETSMRFVLDACLRGDSDNMKSPSANIVLGKPIQSGSGAFDLYQPIRP